MVSTYVANVFVYGSLRFGGKNFFHYLSNSLKVGVFLTKEKFIMYGVELPFPFVRRRNAGELSGGGKRLYMGNVRGEVYQVTLATLSQLDKLEGHPEFFRRELIELETYKKWVWCYLWANEDGHVRDGLLPPNVANILDWKPTYQTRRKV